MQKRRLAQLCMVLNIRTDISHGHLLPVDLAPGQSRVRASLLLSQWTEVHAQCLYMLKGDLARRLALQMQYMQMHMRLHLLPAALLGKFTLQSGFHDI